MQSEIIWLHGNKDYGVFNLHINVFDPHEPWDLPQSYNDLDYPGYSGEQVIYPTYAPPGYMNGEELNHMRALCAAEATAAILYSKHKMAGLDPILCLPTRN